MTAAESSRSNGDSLLAFIYGAGAEFSYEFNFRNDGSRSVKVTGFPDPAGVYYAELIAVDIDDDDIAADRGGSVTDWRPFTPFTIDPDERRFVRFSYRFRSNCEIKPTPANHNPAEFYAGGWWDTQEVEYEVMGISRTTSLQLLSAVGTEVSGQCDF